MHTIEGFANARNFPTDTQVSTGPGEAPVLTAVAVAGVLAMGAAMFAAGNMVTDYVGAESPADSPSHPGSMSADEVLAVREVATQL